MLLVIGATVASVLFVARLLTAAAPLLPLAVLLDPVVSRGTAAACFLIGTFIGISIYLPAYLGLVLGLAAVGTGSALRSLHGRRGELGATLAGRLMGHLRATTPPSSPRHRHGRPPSTDLAPDGLLTAHGGE